MKVNIIGLFDAMADLFREPREAIPWGMTAKEKDELLLKPGKAPAAKKKHRKMVEQSRRKNR